MHDGLHVGVGDGEEQTALQHLQKRTQERRGFRFVCPLADLLCALCIANPFIRSAIVVPQAAWKKRSLHAQVRTAADFTRLRASLRKTYFRFAHAILSRSEPLGCPVSNAEQPSK